MIRLWTSGWVFPRKSNAPTTAVTSSAIKRPRRLRGTLLGGVLSTPSRSGSAGRAPVCSFACRKTDVPASGFYFPCKQGRIRGARWSSPEGSLLRRPAIYFGGSSLSAPAWGFEHCGEGMSCQRTSGASMPRWPRSSENKVQCLRPTCSGGHRSFTV